MPVKPCSKNGKSGYKWGDSGKCYTGPGAREKAIKQGKAIKAQSKGSRMRELLEDIEKVLANKSE